MKSICRPAVAKWTKRSYSKDESFHDESREGDILTDELSFIILPFWGQS